MMILNVKIVILFAGGKMKNTRIATLCFTAIILAVIGYHGILWKNYNLLLFVGGCMLTTKIGIIFEIIKEEKGEYKNIK